jgi:hypothetical protein
MCRSCWNADAVDVFQEDSVRLRAANHTAWRDSPLTIAPPEKAQSNSTHSVQTMVELL